MIPYILAIVVTSISLVLFVIAFSIPKIHRRDDFVWSSLGLFYALILWFSAKQMTTTLVVGQVAIVTLLSIYFWEIVKLRRVVTSSESITKLSGFSLVGFIGYLLNRFSEFINILKDKLVTYKKERETTGKSEVTENKKPGFIGKLFKGKNKDDSSLANDGSTDLEDSESITIKSEDINNKETTESQDSIDIVPESTEDEIATTATNIKQEEDEKEKNITSLETNLTEAIDESLEENKNIEISEPENIVRSQVSKSKKKGFFGKFFKRKNKDDSFLASDGSTDLEDSELIDTDNIDIDKPTSKDGNNEAITENKDSIDIVPESTEDTVIETTVITNNIKQEEETNWDDEKETIIDSSTSIVETTEERDTKNKNI